VKKIIYLLFSAYFLAGMLLLQQSDFCSLQDLPAMYRHCKAFEDKDLTPLDFITDHLLDLDCIIDQHDKGDPQKPHQSPQYNHENCQNFFLAKEIDIYNTKPVIVKQNLRVYSENMEPGEYFDRLFRPPIC
jgi:hypothetical protein